MNFAGCNREIHSIQCGKIPKFFCEVFDFKCGYMVHTAYSLRITAGLQAMRYTTAMNILEAIILGLAQGLTEFIPVSSSGHLVLLHSALGVTENGLTFDIALHLGTLMALVIYF